MLWNDVISFIEKEGPCWSVSTRRLSGAGRSSTFINELRVINGKYHEITVYPRHVVHFVQDAYKLGKKFPADWTYPVPISETSIEEAVLEYGDNL